MELSGPFVDSIPKKVFIFLALLLLVLITCAIYYAFLQNTKTERVFGSSEQNAVMPSYFPAVGKVYITEPDYDKGLIAQVTIQGRIKGKPKVNSETGEVFLRVGFNSGSDIISSDVILGSGEDIISTALIPNGIFGDTIGFNTASVNDINPLLKKGDPIFITIPLLEEVPIEIAEEDNRCEEVCEKYLLRATELFQDSKLLTDSITNKTSIDRALKVGPASQLIIYKHND
jgi:hypothetical protein